MRIFGVSDVSVGYGSPEVPALMHSICELFGGKGVLIEPDEISRPPVALDWPAAFELRRITTDFPDHTLSWHAQYLGDAMRLVNRERPDVLVIFGSSVFASILGLVHKPRTLIYHAYEFISGLSEHDKQAHRLLLDRVDLLIAPDVERLVIDLETVGARPKRTAPIYNVADVAHPHPVLTAPAGERNGRFLYYGTLHRKFAFTDYFWDPLLRDYNFDIFGRITDPESRVVLGHLLAAPNVRYHGVLSAADLNERRRHASFSLVWWNPEINPGYYYVPPNRFFTSIQAHVPPIVAPHPQCVTLVKRYGCGLLMPDWSLGNLKRTLAKAADMRNTAAYDRLVQGCIDAVEAELNWMTQFARLEPALRAAAA